MTNTPAVTVRRAADADYTSLMTLLNSVFDFMNKDIVEGGFVKLLPKLYKKEYNPCPYNICVYEGNDIYAAVGLFPNTLHVADKTLRLGGIGNVAVHEQRRGAGYMKLAMKQALADMKADGIDLAFLGGRRHRYQYFSFDHAAPYYDLSMDEMTLRHALAGKNLPQLSVIAVTNEHERALDDMHRLQKTLPLHAERERQPLHDILLSWKAKPYAAYDGERFAGYFLFDVSKTYLVEFVPQTLADAPALCAAALPLASIGQEELHHQHIFVPGHDTALLHTLLPLSEGCELKHGQQISILNFERVIAAFLRLKASTTPLPDGSLTLHICGEAGDETLHITVKDNAVSVTPTQQPPDLSLSHLEALRLVGAMYSEHRASLPVPCAAWFPLPIHIPSPDGV